MRCLPSLWVGSSELIGTMPWMIDPLPSPMVELDAAVDALNELDARCCDPGRSPRMVALRNQLDQVRELLPLASTDETGAAATLAALEQAGAMIGALQIGCCAPNRLPLYARMLDQLTKIQIEINRTLPA